MTEKETRDVLCSIRELDPYATYGGRATGTVINKKKVSKPIFMFIIKQGSEKELFFKLRLKYANFVLHLSAGHAMLIAYGSD